MTDDVLGSDPRPLFFRVENPTELGLQPPEARRGLSLRTWAWSLSGMQKEAVVLNGATGVAWRLASDEGPYLAGFDAAPCPLSFLTTGMVSSYMNEITALAAAREIPVDDIELTLDNYYTMEGSALRGTMVGGALPPKLSVEIGTFGSADAVRSLVAAAVVNSPISGLLGAPLASAFTLSLNGVELPLGRVASIDRTAEPDPIQIQRDRVAAASTEVVISRLTPAAEVEGVPGGVNSSLAEDQRRVLHAQGVCTLREDGVKEIVQNLYQPIGSEFKYLSDEADGFGGRGLAPDAATYMSAGIAFCFLTQFGRYAKIVKKDLAGYRIIQDTHFTQGGEVTVPKDADPVETHVYLEASEGADFARTILDMSEQTCFLHALCRSELDTSIDVSIKAPA